MASNYYLINNNKYDPSVLNVPYKNQVKRAFEDISLIDVAFLDMGDYVDYKLDECNKKYNSNDGLYILKTPARNKLQQALAPIIVDNPELDKMLERFRYFAEQRAYNVEHNEKLALKKDGKLDSFVKSLISDLYNTRYKSISDLISYDSLISKKSKELIYRKNTGYAYEIFEQYYDQNSYLFRSLFSSYTELRNLAIMYATIKLRYAVNDRTNLYLLEEKNVKGLYDINEDDMHKIVTTKQAKIVSPTKESPDEGIIYQQMELNDFISDIPKVNRLTKKNNTKDLLY